MGEDTTRTQLARPGKPARGSFLTPPAGLWYCELVKNITVSVDEDTYRLARVKAAERGTSVSALVKGFLVSLAADGGDFERLTRDEEALRERIRRFRAGDRLSREELHGRR